MARRSADFGLSAVFFLRIAGAGRDEGCGILSRFFITTRHATSLQTPESPPARALAALGIAPTDRAIAISSIGRNGILSCKALGKFFITTRHAASLRSSRT